ncbi:MAG: prolipoprotein diacylglyceryl transferase, partial [bacterium]|nr:prolipoprotein diacylglyceryl transferase [bacterium]
MNPHFTIGPLTVYYYGLIVALGLIVTYLFARVRAPRYHVPPALLDSALFVTVPLGVIGARLYFV